MTPTRWVVAADDGLHLQTGALPELLPGQAVIRTMYVGICGSDLHAMAGDHPFVPLPYRPGHEVVAVVERLGLGGGSRSAGAAAGFGPAVVSVGDRVVVEPTLFCGQCKQCRRGTTNLCERLDFFGCGNDQGGMAELSVIRTDRLHVLPEGLSFEQAALIEPLATPVHAVRIAAGSRHGERADLSGKTVAVLGAGTIGLLVLAACRWADARRIVVTDIVDSKRQRALDQGADAVVDGAAPDVADRVRAELGESADIVFDCVSIESTLLAGISMALKGGAIIVVGVPVDDATIPLPVIQDRQVRIQGTITYTSQDYAEAMHILTSGLISPADFITEVAGLEHVEEAVAAARSGSHVKVLIKP